MIKTRILELLIIFSLKYINGIDSDTIKIKFNTLKFSDEKTRAQFNINNNFNNKDYNSYEEKYFYYDLILNNIYSEILIGSQAQKIIGFFSGKSDIFALISEKCFINNSKYDRMLSNTFQNLTKFNICYKKYENCCFAQEYFEFESYDIDKKIIFNNLKFFLTDEKEKDSNTCSLIGLRLNYQDMFIENPKNFIHYIIQYFSINRPKKLNSYYWTIKYLNNNEGYLSIGEPPHIYDSENYESKKFHEFNMEARYSTMNWMIQFKEIYLNQSNEIIYLKKYFEGHNCLFYPELNIILSTIDYFNLIKKEFFTKFINQNFCFIKKAYISERNSTIIEGISGEYTLFYCDKNKIIEYGINRFYSEFPSLNFYHSLFNYSFTFYGKDLFYEDNISKKIYFLIGIKNNEVDQWIFGKTFLKKYQIVFNSEMKTLGYYTTINDIIIKKQNNSTKINHMKLSILIIAIIVFISLLGYIVFKFGNAFIKDKQGIALELELIKNQ